MTNQEITEKLERKYTEYEVIEISRMPFGAYVYAREKSTGKVVTFTIDF